VQQGGEPQKLADPGPQFGGHFGNRVGRQILTGVDRLGPGDGQISTRPVGPFDQVARLWVSRMPGPPHHFYNLTLERVMGMRHTHQLTIV